ncbi:MAG: carboxypeptidase-like regulatory domain-containing protein, partial [Bacteroidota bacterium]
MQKSILLTLLLLSITRLVSAQGTVRGKVSDNLGEALIGVTVVVKGNTTIGSSTDFDGNYSLRLPDDKPVVLLISYIGFRTLEEQVQVTGGGVVVKNFVLQSSAVEVKEVQVEAKAVKAANYFMENMKKQSATTIDYISSETMRKTGDNNVASAVSRVTGVSNTSTGFITVRGIGDRYIRTTVNGSTIPTLDPFTNNIRLDFIPANLVDNIIITKTASPDLPGNWAGAYISVDT